MINTKGTKPVHIKAGDRRLEAARRGWNDARTGRAYDYSYIDTLPMVCGIAYENWRLRALEVIGQGEKPPAWNTDKGIPPKVKGLTDRVMLHVVRSNQYLGPMLIGGRRKAPPAE